jgi:hypothetical protein
MIEQLAEHGVTASDLVPSLVTTHTVPNPEYDPDTVSESKTHPAPSSSSPPSTDDTESDITNPQGEAGDSTAPSATQENDKDEDPSASPNLIQPLPNTLPGVSTSLTTADATVTLDIRWTVLCDLFLALIADSVYDARSRVLLCEVAGKLGLEWLDVVRFEKRLTEALEIQEGVQDSETGVALMGRKKRGQKRRMVMMGLATLG